MWLKAGIWCFEMRRTDRGVGSSLVGMVVVVRYQDLRTCNGSRLTINMRSQCLEPEVRHRRHSMQVRLVDA